MSLVYGKTGSGSRPAPRLLFLFALLNLAANVSAQKHECRADEYGIIAAGLEEYDPAWYRTDDGANEHADGIENHYWADIIEQREASTKPYYTCWRETKYQANEYKI